MVIRYRPFVCSRPPLAALKIPGLVLSNFGFKCAGILSKACCSMQQMSAPVSYSPTNPVRETEIGKCGRLVSLFAKKWISCFTYCCKFSEISCRLEMWGVPRSRCGAPSGPRTSLNGRRRSNSLTSSPERRGRRPVRSWRCALRSPGLRGLLCFHWESWPACC